MWGKEEKLTWTCFIFTLITREVTGLWLQTFKEKKYYIGSTF